jgi:CHC2 zinc finger
VVVMACARKAPRLRDGWRGDVMRGHVDPCRQGCVLRLDGQRLVLVALVASSPASRARHGGHQAPANRDGSGTSPSWAISPYNDEPIRPHQSGAAEQPCAFRRNFSTSCVPGFLYRKSLASGFSSKKWGANGKWKGLSPFNKERLPSFFVSDEKGLYHDFSSGKHGDIFTFTMEMEGLTFPEAVERLTALAGLAMPA